jgi:hypothetical protein
MSLPDGFWLVTGSLQKAFDLRTGNELFTERFGCGQESASQQAADGFRANVEGGSGLLDRVGQGDRRCLGDTGSGSVWLLSGEGNERLAHPGLGLGLIERVHVILCFFGFVAVANSGDASRFPLNTTIPVLEEFSERLETFSEGLERAWNICVSCFPGRYCCSGHNPRFHS